MTLSVGLLLDSLTVPKWVANIVAEIQASDYADLALVVVNDAPPTRRRFSDRLRSLPYSLYLRADNWAFRLRIRDNAFTPIDLSPLLRDCTTLRARPLQKRSTDRFTGDDVARVQSANLDVLLRFGFRILKGDVLRAARYGVWSYHHDDNRFYRGVPAGFWEMYRRDPASGVTLQILTEELDAGKVIARSVSSTDFSSLLRNRNNVYWKAARFIQRRLRELNNDPAAIDRWLEENHDTRLGPIYRLPKPHEAVSFAIRTAARIGSQRLRTTMIAEQWFLAYAERPVSLLSPHTASFQYVLPPRDRFYADPFVVENDGQAYVFFEDASMSTGKAHISCSIIADNRMSMPRTVLDRTYNLSYPSVMKWQDTWFMTPETASNRTVELYRAVAFPWEWELDTVLLRDINAVDPTIVHYADRFWMFINVAEGPMSTLDELHLFHADDIRGPWVPHARNPVISHVSRARPAGRPFIEGGVLYRPSQDNLRGYGSGIRINMIEEMTLRTYRETTVLTLDPGWIKFPGNTATHTFTASKRWLVTDGRRTRPRLRR